MKKILLAILCLTSTAFAESLVCTLDGSTYGITRIDAGSEGLDQTEDVFSSITTKDVRGNSKKSEMHVEKGLLNQDQVDFEIAPNFESSPFGIKKVYVVREGSKYNLEVRNYCNFTYQEETCLDGDLLDKTVQEIRCSMDW